MSDPNEIANYITERLNAFSISDDGDGPTNSMLNHNYIKKILGTINDKTYIMPALGTLLLVISILIITFQKTLNSFIKILLIALLVIVVLIIISMAKTQYSMKQI